MLGGVDEDVFGYHGAVYAPGLVGVTDGHQWSAPHPGRVARVDALGVGASHRRQIVEAGQSVQYVAVPLDQGFRVAVADRSDQPGREGPVTLQTTFVDPTQCGGLRPDQVVVPNRTVGSVAESISLRAASKAVSFDMVQGIQAASVVSRPVPGSGRSGANTMHATEMTRIRGSRSTAP